MTEPEPLTGGEDELVPERAQELVLAGEAQLVDVRAPEEHDAGRIEGDILVPFDELQQRIGELDRSRPVIFYCRGGERSGTAAEAFAASGWDAHSIAGGLLGWVERGLPLEPADGHVAERNVLPPA